jgi:hypothetical protein
MLDFRQKFMKGALGIAATSANNCLLTVVAMLSREPMNRSKQKPRHRCRGFGPYRLSDSLGDFQQANTALPTLGRGR